jgi:hypothetical protein
MQACLSQFPGLLHELIELLRCVIIAIRLTPLSNPIAAASRSSPSGNLHDWLLNGSLIAAFVGLLGNWLLEDFRRSRLRFELRAMPLSAEESNNGLRGSSVHIRNAGRSEARSVILFASPRDRVNSDHVVLFMPLRYESGASAPQVFQSSSEDDLIVHWPIIHPKDRVIVHFLWTGGLERLNASDNNCLRVSYQYGCSGKGFPRLRRVTREWVTSPQRKKTLLRLQESAKAPAVSAWIELARARVELLQHLEGRLDD